MFNTYRNYKMCKVDGGEASVGEQGRVWNGSGKNLERIEGGDKYG